MKKIATIVMLIIFLFAFIQSACAVEGLGGGINTPSEEEIPEDQGGIVERSIAGLVNCFVILFEALEKTLELKTIDELVFNNGLTEEQKELLPFGKENWEDLNMLYQGMAACFSIFILVAIIVTAVKLMAAGVSPRMRQEATESIWRWILAIVFIAAAPIIFWVTLNLNIYVVDGMISVASDAAADIDDLAALRISGLSEDSSEDSSKDSSMAVEIRTGSVLGTAFVKLMICGVSLYINMLYMIRKFALAVIFVFTPVMAWMWAVNKNVNAAGIWFGELLSNAFMQTAHALVFLVYLTICTASEFGTQWLESIIWMMVIIPTAEMIRNSVQGLFTRLSGLDEAGAVGKVMGAAGLTSLVGIGGLARATTGGVKIPSGSVSADGSNDNGNMINGRTVPAAIATGMIANTPSPNLTVGTTVSREANILADTTPVGGSAAVAVPADSEASYEVANTSSQRNVTSEEKDQLKLRTQAMTNAINTGRRIGNAAAVGAGLLGRAMFAATPYSKEAQDFMGRAGGHIGGAVGRATGLTAAMLWQIQKQREEGQSTKETFNKINNADNTKEAAKNYSKVTLKEIFNPRANDIDGYRSRTYDRDIRRSRIKDMDAHRWRE